MLRKIFGAAFAAFLVAVAAPPGFGSRQHEQPEPTGRGCCSWHGGVCGCESGRVVCCDGKLSPSCRC